MEEGCLSITDLQKSLMQRLETSWPGERSALMQARLEEHEKLCLQEQDAHYDQSIEGVRALDARISEACKQVEALNAKRRAFCTQQDDALLAMKIRQDKERARIVHEWGAHTAVDSLAQLQFVASMMTSHVLLPSSQHSAPPPQAAAEESSSSSETSSSISSSSSSSSSPSLPPKDKEEESEYPQVLSVGLEYDCEKTASSKRPREQTTTYLDVFPGAEPVGSEEEDEEEDEVELFGENLKELEKQRDANFIDDEDDDLSNYDYDEEDIDDDDEDDEESSSSDSCSVRQMDILDDDEIVDLSSSSSPETRKKKKNSRYEPLQMTQEPTRKQPRRQARENAQPTLRRMFDRQINGLVDTLGNNKPKTRRNFVNIDNALSTGAKAGEWDSYDLRVGHKCDFCVKKATKCGCKIAIGPRTYYCGTTCIWSVRPMIDLLIHVHTATHTRAAEEQARDLVSLAQEGVQEKTRFWKKWRGDAEDEDDVEDDNGIDISKKKRRQRD
jgi:hypothetical protein